MDRILVVAHLEKRAWTSLVRKDRFGLEELTLCSGAREPIFNGRLQKCSVQAEGGDMIAFHK